MDGPIVGRDIAGIEMTHWLIDDTGEICDARTAHPRAGQSFQSPAECANQLVVDAGFISLATVPHGLLMRWRPARVRRETLAGAVLFLLNQPEQRVILESFIQSWRTRLLPSLTAARSALFAELSSVEQVEGGFYAARPRDPDSLPSTSALRSVLNASLAAELRMEPGTLWNALQSAMARRYLVLDAGSSNSLRIVTVGRGFEILRKLREMPPGRPFEDQPDPRYAQEAARACWTALETGRPTIEDVEASVWLPSEGRTDLCYTRLVLPLDIGGKRRVVIASETRDR